MLSSIMNIGVSGLAAAQGSLATTAHNIANANVAGYSRQYLVLTPAGAQSPTAGFYGRGVEVTTVLRHYDQFLAQSVQGLASLAAADRTRADALAELDAVFGDPQAGLGAAIDTLFGAIGDVASRPGEAAARQVLLSTLQQTALRFNAVGAQLDDLRAQADARIGVEAAQVNERLTQLNQLNQQIVQVSGAGRPPNDLLDQRDAVLLALGGFMAIRTVPADDGSLSIFTAGGQPLLVGQQQSVLEATADPADVSRTALRLRVGETASWLDEAALGGGSLAGQIRFRDADLAAVQAQAGRLATVLASGLNAQQALGVDAQGQPGEPLFSLPQPVARAHAANTGAGELTVRVADASRLEASDYQVRWDGTSYSVTRLSDQRVFAGVGLPQVIDGLAFDAAGAPAAGDAWVVKPYEQAAAGLRTATLSPAQLATGLATVAQAAATNTGTAKVASHAVVRASADATTPVRITFNDPPTSFNVTGVGGGPLQNVPFVPGQSIPPAPADYNGWRMVLEGRPNAGDAFDVVRNPQPGTDNRNAIAMGRLASQGLVQGSTLNEGYARLLADAGTRVQTARDLADVSGRMRTEAQSRRENLSGVNLDEEAANLLRHQQSYQACAKIIQATQSLFESLLAATGR